MDANSGLYPKYNGDEQTVYWGEKISFTTNGTPLAEFKKGFSEFPLNWQAVRIFNHDQ